MKKNILLLLAFLSAAAFAQDDPPQTAPVFETNIGLRLAYNLSRANVDVYSFDRTESGYGHGFEIGGRMSTSLLRFLSVHYGGNLIFRGPVNSPDLSVREIGVAVPALIRVGGQDTRVPLFAEAGLQLDFVLSDIDKRNPVDAGYAVGGGVFIGKYVEIDSRLVWGLVDFADVPEQRGGKLFQYSLGLTVMFGGQQ